VVTKKESFGERAQPRETFGEVEMRTKNFFFLLLEYFRWKGPDFIIVSLYFYPDARSFCLARKSVKSNGISVWHSWRCFGAGDVLKMRPEV